MADLSGVKVGDVLWYQPTDTRYKGHEITVTKVEGDYAYYCGHKSDRFCLSNGFRKIIGHSMDGRIYRSHADYDAEIAIARSWQELIVEMTRAYVPPASVTLDNINQARALLGLDQA
jgi:hypothetical protein